MPHTTCRDSVLKIMHDLVEPPGLTFKELLPSIIELLQVYAYLASSAKLNNITALKPFFLSECFDGYPTFDEGTWAFLLSMEFGQPYAKYFDSSIFSTLLTNLGYRRLTFRFTSESISIECMDFAVKQNSHLAIHYLYIRSLHDSNFASKRDEILQVIVYKARDSYVFFRYFAEFCRCMAIEVLDNTDFPKTLIVLDRKQDCLDYIIKYIQSLRFHDYFLKDCMLANAVKKLPKISHTITAKKHASYSRYKAIAQCLIGDELLGLNIGIEKDPICLPEFSPKFNSSSGDLSAVQWHMEALSSNYAAVKNLVLPKVRAEYDRLQKSKHW